MLLPLAEVLALVVVVVVFGLAEPTLSAEVSEQELLVGDELEHVMATTDDVVVVDEIVDDGEDGEWVLGNCN